MRPSARRTTLSAISAMAALWVMTTVAVSSSRLTRARASRTTMPVAMSSAPVGSSQSNTAGRLAMAGRWPPAAARRPTAGRKVVHAIGEIDPLKRLFGVMGLTAISVTRATFSRR